MNMFDGLESARSRKPDHFEECILGLAYPCTVHRIELDFTYFVNNNPLFVSLEGKNEKGDWITLAEKYRVKAFASNKIAFEVSHNSIVSEVRLKTIPDGGVNRIAVFSFKK